MVSIINKNAVATFKTTDDLFQFSAQDFCHRAITAVQKSGVFSVALSGGNTPKAFFDVLASNEDCKKKTPWQNIHFYFGDERYVPADDISSNYHTAYEHLFSKVPINPDHIYRIPTEFKDPNDAAKAYEKTLRESLNSNHNAALEFDLLYLGLGDNAHTASLMPGSDIVKFYAKGHHAVNQQPLTAALFDTNSKLERITLTPTILNQSKAIVFLVAGLDKATPVWQVIEGPRDPVEYPAQLIHSVHGLTHWYLDVAAAAKLTLKDE